MAEEDIIYGKNRHFFGGIEPSNMKIFTASATISGGQISSSIVINAQLPDDTIVNEQTLCTVAGAVIRKAYDHYPKDEFDGELVANVTGKDLVSIVDNNIPVATSAWYYAAFPYTTQGVYNRNPMNRASVNEPWPLDGFSASQVLYNGNRYVHLKLTAPAPGYAPITSVIIRRSTDHYPTSISDGEEVETVYMYGSSMVEVSDDNVVVDCTYYYSAFPCNEFGNVNISDYSTATCTIRAGLYYFGYDLDVNDSNPATRVSYPSDVENVEYESAYMDFSAATFNYGDWPNEAGVKFMPKPCILDQDGSVYEYLDPNDYTKTADGSKSSIYNTTATTALNAMMEWPKIWTKRWEENGVYHFRCSDVKIDDDYECWCNYNHNGDQVDHFYTSIFIGKVMNSTLKSTAFDTSYVYDRHTVSRTYSANVTAACNNGDGWYIEQYVDRLLIQDLLIMMGKSTDLASVYGSGISVDGSTGVYENTMLNKGLFGYSPSDDGSVQIFGMEHWWGCLYRQMAGLTVNSGMFNVKYTRSTVDGSTATDYNGTGEGYLPLFDQPLTSSNNSLDGYISECIFTPIGRIPYAVGGSSTMYECSYLYVSLTGDAIARTWTHPLGLNMTTSATGSDARTGAALSYK